MFGGREGGGVDEAGMVDGGGTVEVEDGRKRHLHA